MADCIGTGFPQFPRALVQMRYSVGRIAAVKFSWGVTLAVRKEGNSDDKEGSNGSDKGIRTGKGGEKGEKVGDMFKASCHTDGNTNKIYFSCSKNTIIYNIFLSHFLQLQSAK